MKMKRDLTDSEIEILSLFRGVTEPVSREDIAIGMRDKGWDCPDWCAGFKLSVLEELGHVRRISDHIGPRDLWKLAIAKCPACGADGVLSEPPQGITCGSGTKRFWMVGCLTKDCVFPEHTGGDGHSALAAWNSAATEFGRSMTYTRGKAL